MQQPVKNAFYINIYCLLSDFSRIEMVNFKLIRLTFFGA